MRRGGEGRGGRGGGGFTLVEVVVALCLLAVISTSAIRVLLANQQMYRKQVELARVNATLRAAAAILPGELRELDPTDPNGGDLIRISPTSITYRALRNLYVVCRPPSGGQSVVTLFADYLGSRPLNPTVDSVLLFADGDPGIGDDDRWLHADLTWVAGGECPGGTPGITVGLGGVSATGLGMVSAGAPLRTGAVMEMLRYRGGDGLWWLGMRRLRKEGGGRRPAVQPLLGPLAPGGLEFSYYDAQGSATTDPTKVASIGILVTAAAPRSQPDAHSAGSLRQRRIAVRVALRNGDQR